MDKQQRYTRAPDSSFREKGAHGPTTPESGYLVPVSLKGPETDDTYLQPVKVPLDEPGPPTVLPVKKAQDPAVNRRKCLWAAVILLIIGTVATVVALLLVTAKPKEATSMLLTEEEPSEVTTEGEQRNHGTACRTLDSELVTFKTVGLVLPGHRALYECPQDYEAVHNQPQRYGYVTCVDGEWETPPRCIRKITTTQRPTTAPALLPCKARDTETVRFVMSGWARSGTERQYECEYGYEVANKPGETWDSSTCNNGTWEPAPQCIEISR